MEEIRYFAEKGKQTNYHLESKGFKMSMGSNMPGVKPLHDLGELLGEYAQGRKDVELINGPKKPQSNLRKLTEEEENDILAKLRGK